MEALLDEAASITSAPLLEQLLARAIEHPDVFVFGEMMDLPLAQSLQQSNPESWTTLELFAYGTYDEYCKMQPQPKLSTAAIKKLRLLSIVSLCSKKKIVAFSDLEAMLRLPLMEAESLVIEAIYRNLISGKIDQIGRTLEVEECTSRDVRSVDIDFIISTLEGFRAKSVEAHGSLGACVSDTVRIWDEFKQAKAKSAEDKDKKNQKSGGTPEMTF